MHKHIWDDIAYHYLVKPKATTYENRKIYNKVSHVNGENTAKRAVLLMAYYNQQSLDFDDNLSNSHISNEFTSELTQKNMEAYYAIRKINWNSEQFNERWKTFENFDVYLNSKRVGVLHFSFGYSSCYLRDLQIEPNYQHKGVGAYGLNYAIDHAKNRSNKFIKLRVCSENPAINFYTSLGFKKFQNQMV